MYQTVDDIDEKPPAPANGAGLNRLRIIAGVLVGIALLIGAAIYSAQNHPPSTGPDEAEAAYAIYTKALTERDPALRRARLLDFTQTYPDHDRVFAATAQLNVLNLSDDSDWAAVTEVVFDPAKSRPAKLAAIQLYEDIWGTDLLGGREAEISELKAKFEEVNDQPPQQDTPATPNFEPRPDKFDPAVNNTEMAGGVSVAERSYIPPVSTPRIPINGNKHIVLPTVRRSVSPRYPGRAERRRIGAEIILSLNVDENGRVQMTEVVSARANRYRDDFIKSAERAALKTRFHPKTVNGVPVPSARVIKKYIFVPEE